MTKRRAKAVDSTAFALMNQVCSSYEAPWVTFEFSNPEQRSALILYVGSTMP